MSETWEEFQRRKQIDRIFEYLLASCAVLASAVLILLILLCFPARAGELEEIAATIAAEACGEGEQGMHAVGSTILNRSKSRHLSVVAVVRQKNQYYGYTAKNRDKLYQQCKPVADKIAQKVLDKTLPDITGGAEYFLLPTEKIRSWHGMKTVTLGKHTFYKEREK